MSNFIQQQQQKSRYQSLIVNICGEGKKKKTPFKCGKKKKKKKPKNLNSPFLTFFCWFKSTDNLIQVIILLVSLICSSNLI